MMTNLVRGILHAALCLLLAACVPIGVRVQNMYAAAPPGHGSDVAEVQDSRPLN